jgi:hypothetical protein
VLILPQKIYGNITSEVLSIASERKGFISEIKDLPAKDSVSPATVGVLPAKEVCSLAKSLFSPVKCGHVLAKVGLSPVRVFFTSERLLIASTNAVYLLAKSSNSPAISKCSPVGRI